MEAITAKAGCQVFFNPQSLFLEAEFVVPYGTMDINCCP